MHKTMSKMQEKTCRILYEVLYEKVKEASCIGR